MIEAAPNDLVRIYFALKDAGLGGLSGESPTVVIRRKRDGLYLQAGGASFGGPGIANPMIEEDATFLPGLYRFDMDLSVADPDAADEYTAYMANDNPPKSGSALDVVFVKNELGFAPGTTRGVYLFVSNAGSPLGSPALSPSVAIQRESDGRFLDESLPDFVTGVAVFNAMAELDQSNQPGVYRFEFDQSVDGALGRYVAYAKELTTLDKVVEVDELDFRGVAGLAAGGLDFDGIKELSDNGLGCLTAKADPVTSPYPPVRYKVFLARASQLAAPEDVFDDAHLAGEIPDPDTLICAEADQVTPLLPLTLYTVGMRVFDARGQEDDNTVTLTVEVTASSRLRLSTGSLRNLSTVGGDAGATP